MAGNGRDVRKEATGERKAAGTQVCRKASRKRLSGKNRKHGIPLISRVIGRAFVLEIIKIRKTDA